MATIATINEVYAPDADRLREFALRALGEVLFWLIVVQLVTGLYLQSQLALFDGRIILPNGVPKLLLVAGIVSLGIAVAVLAHGRIALRPCMFPASIFACYLGADMAWLAATSKLPIGALLFGFNKYFLFFAAIPAAALLRPRMTARQMNARFLFLLVPLAAVSLAQFLTNDALLPTSTEDNAFTIDAVDFYGQIRAFSLFRGVLECGQGMAFFGALLIARLCTPARQHATRDTILLALAVAASLVTFRRGAYMEFGAAGLSAVAIARGWSISRWLPWIYFAVAIALASAGTVLGSVQGETVLSSESLAERHEAWNTALDKWLLREDPSVLLGTGLAQTSLLGTGLAQIESDEVDYFLVDNGFLAVGAQLGLVGLGLWCWVMHSLWSDTLASAWRTRSTLAIAVAALLSTWMMRDMFDPLFSLYPLYAFLVFWTDHDFAPAVRAPAPAR